MKFKCKASGNVIEFTAEHDIKSTLDNPAYEEVVEVKLPEPVKEITKVVKPVKE